MILEYSNAAAAGAIAWWATWAVLSGKVRDGVIGKLLYVVIALSGYALLARAEYPLFSVGTAGVTLHIALALAGLRHMFMLTYWPAFRRWLERRITGAHCKRDH
ncbi:hypothetical protein [Pseudomonas cremoricolorata]|uniref:Uncharacterized protein n=1 Tax=Pseudomonas cremoricolorata TaxID=157783 RepID=A0A089WNA0_9PSED|nr:hypothetical protein [Pseudomonas cremoricolorata]AIR90755.1 hypothetical protein LK03_16420 [Pseudomonas cremoricolorata]